MRVFGFSHPAVSFPSPAAGATDVRNEKLLSYKKSVEGPKFKSEAFMTTNYVCVKDFSCRSLGPCTWVNDFSYRHVGLEVFFPIRWHVEGFIQWTRVRLELLIDVEKSARPNQKGSHNLPLQNNGLSPPFLTKLVSLDPLHWVSVPSPVHQPYWTDWTSLGPSVIRLAIKASKRFTCVNFQTEACVRMRQNLLRLLYCVRQHLRQSTFWTLLLRQTLLRTSPDSRLECDAKSTTSPIDLLDYFCASITSPHPSAWLLHQF